MLRVAPRAKLPMLLTPSPKRRKEEQEEAQNGKCETGSSRGTGRGSRAGKGNRKQLRAGRVKKEEAGEQEEEAE